MIPRKTWEEGLKVEREHKDTYQWLCEFIKKNKRMPKDTDFFLHIVMDHLKEDMDYYTKLKKEEL